MPSFHADARVLIVDDAEENIRILERIIRNAGYGEVHSTSDPQQAMPLFEQAPPDIVLLDLHMPLLDGFQIMEQIRAATTDVYLPILVLTGDQSGEIKARALSAGATDFLTKPFDKTEVLLRINNLLETRKLHSDLQAQNVMLEIKIQERTKDLQGAVSALDDSAKDLRLAQEETIRRLSLAAEHRDQDTGRHIERMSRYGALLARRIGREPEWCDLFRLASEMHDVGKIGVPDAILLKPGPLTPDERGVMETHAEVGHGILGGSPSDLVKMAASIALTHHEHWDGTGYPRGLRGNAIPLEGRIAAIADVFDAVTSDRVYRKAFELDEALDLVRQGRGSHFDAELTDVFFDSLDDILALRDELSAVTPAHVG